MVVLHSTDTTREAIACRLRQALEKLKIPARRRATWLSRRLEARGVQVTHQATRKWLTGESAPGLDHLRLIALDLGISLDFLVLGRGPMFAVTNSSSPYPWPFREDLYARYEALGAADRVRAEAALHICIIDLEELRGDGNARAPGNPGEVSELMQWRALPKKRRKP